MSLLGAAHGSVVLTFLAPAKRCNQRCPRCYLTEVTHEPVHHAELSPADYADFVTQFVDAGIPVRAINFQGYEVTLAPSWPYLEAVFAVGQRHNIRRSFITNGMLLHRYADRVRALDPVRVAVSLDGASPEANDSLRGLPGAFATTVASLEKFLRKAPRMRDRLVVCSCLYTPKNVRSLLDMPRLLARLGVERWALSFELGARGRKVGPVQSAATLRQWIAPIQEAARAEGIQCHVNDEFDFLERDTHAYERSGITTHRVFNPERLYRLDPLGFVRSGRALLEVWDAASARRWNPRSDNAVEVTGYPKLRPGMNARA